MASIPFLEKDSRLLKRDLVYSFPPAIAVALSPTFSTPATAPRWMHFLRSLMFRTPSVSFLSSSALLVDDSWRSTLTVLHFFVIKAITSHAQTFKIVDAMSASNFCCTHPQTRIDSPEPPSRPLATIDGIFAAAALPEDHPHALKFPEPLRKPELDASIAGIVRSPNIASKIKLQFRRNSVKSLRKEREYDPDAHQLSSVEVLNDVGEAANKKESQGNSVDCSRFGSVLDLCQTASPKPDVRTSVMRSLGYLAPMLRESVSPSSQLSYLC